MGKLSTYQQNLSTMSIKRKIKDVRRNSEKQGTDTEGEKRVNKQTLEAQ